MGLKSLQNFILWVGTPYFLLKATLKKSWRGYKWLASWFEVRTTYGSAKFAKASELPREGGFLVGTVEGRPIHTKPERSLLFFGPPGSGKSMLQSISLRCSDGWDFLSIEQPGDIRRLTLDKLHQEKGYGFYVIDVDAVDGAYYDPFSFFRESTGLTLNRDITAFVSLVVLDDNQSNSKHFTETARLIVEGAINHMAAESYNMDKGMPWLCETLCAGGKQFDDFMAVLSKSLSVQARIGASTYYQAGEKGEKGAIMNTLRRNLTAWTDASIKRVCTPRKGNNLVWEDVFDAKHPVGVFLIGGLGANSVVAPLARVLAGNCINSIRRRFNRTRMPLVKGLKVFVDECQNLGAISPFSDGVGELRKARFNLFAGLLSPNILISQYGHEKGEEILGNCDWLIAGGYNNAKFYRDVSELMGKYTVLSSGQSEGEEHKSLSKHEAGRSLMTADEIRRLPETQLIGLLSRTVVRLERPNANDY